MKPHVTAIIPCMNHHWCVLEAIHSVASQKYPNKSIVVVDDGSTDNTIDCIKTIIDELTTEPIITGTVIGYNVPIAVLSFNKTHGPSFARNRGISYAWEKADIFAFLDSDDLYEEGKIEKSVNKLLEDPAIGAVYTDYDTLNPKIDLRIRQYKEPYCRARLMNECIVNCDSLVTKSALSYAGGFFEELRVVEDYDLWLRISKAYLISHIPESLVTIRVGDHSSSNSVPKHVWEECWRKVAQRANS